MEGVYLKKNKKKRVLHKNMKYLRTVVLYCMREERLGKKGCREPLAWNNVEFSPYFVFILL